MGAHIIREAEMNIVRHKYPLKDDGRPIISRVVEHAGIVYVCGTLPDPVGDVATQTFVAAIESVVRDGTDRQLCRINVLNFAAKQKLGEEKTISGFLNAARLGLFELSWNVLCPGCGGVLDATQTLKSVHKEAYDCALCAARYEPTLDEMVEVAFTV